MGNVLEFNELPEGAQIGVGTTDRGVISGVAVPNGGSGGGGFELLVVTDDVSWTFVSGTPGVNEKQLASPLTIVQCRTIVASRTYKLTSAGFTNGWFVAFNIEGADPGNVNFTNNDDVLLCNVDVSHPADTVVPYPVFYFDEDLGFVLLRSRILVP